MKQLLSRIKSQVLQPKVANMVKVRDNAKVDLSKEPRSGIIIGVPAAFCVLMPSRTKVLSCPSLHRLRFQRFTIEIGTRFSPTDQRTNNPQGPTCSDSYIPEYIYHRKLKPAGGKSSSLSTICLCTSTLHLPSSPFSISPPPIFSLPKLTPRKARTHGVNPLIKIIYWDSLPR